MKLRSLQRRASGKRLLAALTALGLIIIVLLNMLLTYVGADNLFYIDMTPEELYTVSDEMIEHTSFINDLDDDERKLKITFCADPDTLTSSLSLRAPYFLAKGLEQIYDRVEVETVNVVYNPTAISQYKANSLTVIEQTDIIVSYGDRYRISSADAFWVNDSDGNLYSFNGEYKLVSMILSVVAKNRPAAYFITNHGETYYDEANPQREENEKARAIYELISERGLEAKTLDLSKVSAIPDDCVLLIINNPTSDYIVDKNQLDSFDYISEVEMIDRYLVLEQGALMVAKDHALELPELDEFLFDWGFDIGDGIDGNTLVEDKESYIAAEDGGYHKIIGQYDTVEENYGMAIYENIASLSSAPSMVFSNTGYIKCSYGTGMSTNEAGTYISTKNFAPFIYSSDTAKAYGKGDGSYSSEVVADASQTGKLILSGVTTRMEINQTTAEYQYSYVFCSPSADAFSNEILGNGSYANFDVMSALVESISRIDEHASIDLGGVSYNSTKIGGKPLVNSAILTEDTYGYNEETGLQELVLHGISTGEIILRTVIVLLVPVIILGIGIAVRLRRKFR